MRRRRVFLAVSTAGTIAVGAGIGFTTASSSASGPPVLSEGQVTHIARQFAAANGDPNPASIAHVQGARKQIVFALSHDEVPNDARVDAIVMRGHFVGTSVSHPPGAPAPRGTVLTLIIDATTGEVTDFGIQNHAPDLASLGPVTRDK